MSTKNEPWLKLEAAHQLSLPPPRSPVASACLWGGGGTPLPPDCLPLQGGKGGVLCLQK